MDASLPNEFRLQALCPRCRKATDCIQAYDIPIGVFLLFYFAVNKQRIVGCPQCVRQSLFKWLFLCIPLMNVFCWIHILAYLAIMSSSRSSERPGVPAEYSYLVGMRPEELESQEPEKKPGGWLRVFVVVLILAVLLGVAVFVLQMLPTK